MGEPVRKLESRWLTAGGYRLHARVSEAPGAVDYPPIVLVHGLSVSSLYWVPTHKHLAPYYRVYAPDFPGFGKSEKPRHILDIPEIADVLAAYMDAVGLDQAVLVANSMGCQITADFALRYPERLLRAVFIGPTMDRYARTRWRQFWRLMLDALREPLSQPFVVFGDYLRTGTRRTLRTAKLAIEDEIEQKLPRMNVPTLVVRGGRDPIVSQRWAEDVTSLLPNARLIVFPNDAHTVHYSAPAELVRLIRPFVDQERKPPSTGRNLSLFRRAGRMLGGRFRFAQQRQG